MNADATSQRPSPTAKSTESIRREVVDVATELMRGGTDPGAYGHPVTTGTRYAVDSSDQSAMNLYLALLMDRLPVFHHTMIELESRIGEGGVEENLEPVALATIQFYCEILSAKVSVFTQPDQLLQLRRVLLSHGMGPHNTHMHIGAYLEAERRLGRVAADLDCEASARLLAGACLNYAFTKMLLDDVEPREEFARQAVRGLRLTS